MARGSDSLLTYAILGVGAYLVYTHFLAPGTTTTAAAGSLQCRYPDGSAAPVNADGTCPFDSSHGGQATPCYPSTFVGPIPPGGVTC